MEDVLATPASKLGDSRTPSQHDCDRILYSDALRRLSDVTQVVATDEMSLVHTRLTHTLKVQQLSRRIAQHLHADTRNGSQQRLGKIGGIDIDAAEAGGLAHDLGHPPFGHIGEEALNERCHSAGLDGYEGNAQTFRILVKTERYKAANVPGLGISDRTLNAVLKYPWLREDGRGRAHKWNAYLSEREQFTRVRQEATNRGYDAEEQTIEAAVMDWADDITYAVHDLEDFIRVGRIPISELVDGSVLMGRFTEWAAPKIQKVYPELSVEIETGTTRFAGTTATLFRSYRGTQADLCRLRSTCSALIGRFVGSASVGDHQTPVKVEPAVRVLVELLKCLTRYFVISDPGLATAQRGQRAMLARLFDTLHSWSCDARTSGEMTALPTRLGELLQLAEESDFQGYSHDRGGALEARAVADFIASLTERQASDLDGRLHGSSGRSITDRWLSY